MERRFVGFSTDVPVTRKIMRAMSGLLGYYFVSFILNTLLKGWIPGRAGTIVTSFLQVFYIAFLFPWIFKRLEKEALPAASAGTERNLSKQ